MERKIKIHMVNGGSSEKSLWIITVIAALLFTGREREGQTPPRGPHLLFLYFHPLPFFSPLFPRSQVMYHTVKNDSQKHNK